MILPSFAVLQRHYPTDHDPDAVRLRIGGSIGNLARGTNTCVMRMSQAFNYAGKAYEIPAGLKHPVTLGTLKGKDGKNYAYNVAQFVKYLHWKFGKPTITTKYSTPTKATGWKQVTKESITPFLNKTGIIAWHVNGWTDATGHFTLWDGKTGLYEGGEDYFTDFPKQPTDPRTGQGMLHPDGTPWIQYETGIDFWTC